MKTKIKIFVAIVCLIGLDSSHAQMNHIEQPYPKYTIGVQPFYLFNGGLRFDFEKQLKTPEEWLQLTVTGYNISDHGDDNYSRNDGWTNSNSNYDPFKKLTGFGFGGAYKRYLGSLPKHYSNSPRPYLSGGAYYTHYNLDYLNSGLLEFKENGLTFYKYARARENQKFNKLNTSVNLGVQSSLHNMFFYDLYLGLGWAYSFYDENKKPFNDNMFGYGYRGLQLTGGIRFGVSF